jgi:hypothetical protein
MKALTICQPYADLICLPDDDARAKRVENRTWGTSYRGALLIHAGKSKQWLSGDNYGLSVAGMTFGAIVGVARLADCVAVRDFMGPTGEAIKRRWPWLNQHIHTEGPFCFVLTECRRFAKPIPYRGAQGFFDLPREVVAEQLEALTCSA